MKYDRLVMMNDKLDTLQDHLIAQDNLIKETLELVEKYLIMVGEEMERFNNES